ncbi:type II secretion system major pseudopilin GspG [Prosthecobacter sp.]|uniref:type II secretion system major pseudopilin GspG n=1 Tax=Prosthecobacter sp. TaxID=1965333 RepID=UPI00378431AC
MKIQTPNSRTRASAAFTLIEIVITLTIIAILAGGSMMMYSSLIDTAKDSRVSSDMEKISLALQSYEGRALRVPTTEQGLQALVDKPTIEPVPDNYRPFMEELPKDPWGQPYKYRTPPQKSKKGYDLWTVGPDGADGTDDDIGNWKKPAATK